MAEAEIDARDELTLESIQQQIRNLPAPLAQAISVRVALRTLPLIEAAWHSESKDFKKELSALTRSVFRACFISWVARKYPTHDMSDAAALAARATALAAAALAARAAALAAADATAFAAAALAARAAAVAAADATALAAADAAARATAFAAADAEYEILESIKRDLDWLDVQEASPNSDKEARALVSRRLWANEAPAWASGAWKKLVEHLQKSDQDWFFWIHWYDARLQGLETNERLGLAIANIDSKIWNEDSVHDHIAKLTQEHGPLVAEDAKPDIAFWPKIVRGTFEIAEKEAEPESEPQTSREEMSEIEATQTPPKDAPPTEPAFDDTVRQTTDSAASNHDYLGRSRPAFVLAGQLQQIWEDRRNADLPPHTPFMLRWTNWFRRMPQAAEAGYVVHIDAPWGGGKTSFANYLTTILNQPAGESSEWLQELQDLTGRERLMKDDWQIVHFNAWQHQHMDPPWWAFYETIRKQMLRGSNPPRRIGRWLLERLWRFTTPQMIERCIITLLVLGVIYILYRFDWTVIDPKTGKLKFENAGAPSLLATLGAAIFGGGTILWTFLSGIYKSLIPGTPEAAKNYSLGTGDPLERFRQHFRRFLARFKRPVLVVVDDLDRCDPKFVVGLIRGMQTILQSPRIFFVLLGDRDWIEQAFTDQHKAMQSIDVGPEHEFGARFVEKAIQLSFVLPEISEEQQKEYVRKILTRGKNSSENDEPEKPDEHDAEQKAIKADLETVRNTVDFDSRTELTEQLRARVEQASFSAEEKTDLQREIQVTEVLTAATDTKAQEEVELRMAGIAHLMPPNPRQIIRIINTLALVQGVAALDEVNGAAKKDFSTGGDDWQILARWIVLMTEWPKTWYTLSKHPALMSQITGRKKKWAPEDNVPNNAKALVAKIKECSQVMDLLKFQPESNSGWDKHTILQSHVEWLKDITPPTSGQLLSVPDEKAPTSS